MVMPARLMLHEKDPAEDIREKIGSLDGIQIMFNHVLVGIYKRPEKTRSGIILADATRDEDIYQGKAALVLKVGPTAFVDDPNNGAIFHGQAVKPGDWIIFRPSDGWPVSYNQQPCRMLQDVHVRAIISSPDSIY